MQAGAVDAAGGTDGVAYTDRDQTLFTPVQTAADGFFARTLTEEEVVADITVIEKLLQCSAKTLVKNFSSAPDKVKSVRHVVKLKLRTLKSECPYAAPEALQTLEQAHAFSAWLNERLNQLLSQEQAPLDAALAGERAVVCEPPSKRWKHHCKTQDLWRQTFLKCYFFYTRHLAEHAGKDSDYGFLSKASLDADTAFVPFDMETGSCRRGCRNDCGLPRFDLRDDQTPASVHMQRGVLLASLKETKNGYDDPRTVVSTAFFHCARCCDKYRVGTELEGSNYNSIKFGIADCSANFAYDKHPVHGRIKHAHADGAATYQLADEDYIDLAFGSMLWTSELARQDQEYNACGDKCAAKKSRLTLICDSRNCRVCARINETRSLARTEQEKFERTLVFEEELLHIQYLMSFYWTGNAVERWRATFKNMLEEKVELRTQAHTATRQRIAQRAATLQASLDEDDHEKRYAQAKRARDELAAQEKAKNAPRSACRMVFNTQYPITEREEKERQKRLHLKRLQEEQEERELQHKRQTFQWKPNQPPQGSLATSSSP